MGEWLEEYLKKKWKESVIVILTVLLVGLTLFSISKKSYTAPVEDWEEWEEEGRVGEKETSGEAISENQESEQIYIDIKGQVAQPGVYQIEAGKRVIDALELASGLTEEADADQLNLALKLTDQMVIYVPSVDEKDSVSMLGIHISSQESQKININTADATQLMTLDGIGQKKAEAILLYREEKGSFKTIEEMKEISGIGEKTFERFKEKIETGF